MVRRGRGSQPEPTAVGGIRNGLRAGGLNG
jgi:hypothetical protein